MKKTIHLISFLFICMALTVPVHAQVAGPPALVDYQGQLLDDQGLPLTGGVAENFTIHFRIWDAQSGGTLIWAEKQIVTVTGAGLFSVRLGEGEPITLANADEDTGPTSPVPNPDLKAAFDGDQRFLGVTVIDPPATPGEIQPRLAFLAAPFSFVAEKAVEAENALTADLALVAEKAVEAENALTADLALVAERASQGPVNGSFTAGSLSTTGSVGVGTSSPQVPLQVNSTSNLSLSDDSGAFMVGNQDVGNIVFDFNEIQARNNGSVATLDLNRLGGDVAIGSSSSKITARGQTVFGNFTDLQLGALVNIQNKPLSLADDTGSLMIGDQNAVNAVYGLHAGGFQGIQARNNGIPWLLWLNPLGGSTFFGSSSSIETFIGTVKIDRVVDANVSSNDGSLMIGKRNSSNLILDNNEIMARNNGVASALVLNANGGDVYIGGGATDTTMTKVGIGTYSPDAPLHVSLQPNFQFYVEYEYNRSGPRDLSNAFRDVPVSIIADGHILSGAGFLVTSDERTKNKLQRSDSADDLATLLNIEVTDYTFKDVISKGADSHKKVIAQQVEAVYPQAVSSGVGVVPDIYQVASIRDGWVTLETDLNPGERVRLIGEKEEGIFEVLEIDEAGFRTEFISDSAQVFVYGREVEDFRSVDYDAISMLNVSATQQLKNEKDAEVQELESRVQRLEALVESLIAE